MLAAGKDLAVKEPADVFSAHDPKSGGSAQNRVLGKVYRIGDQASQPQSWGDVDRDRVVQYVIDLYAGGVRAVPLIRSAEAVIDRVLQRHRVLPNAAWDRFESWRISNPESYHDGQRLLITVNLATRGEVISTPLKAR